MEGLSKSALIKSLSPRVMLSNHLLPKGTKMRVNLEDQGRQKVSFTFSQTKKPLQSSFFVSANPDTTVAEPPSTLSQSTSDKGGKNIKSKTEQKRTSMPSSTPETISQTFYSTRLKTNLAKMHFKKQILSVSVSEEKPTPVTPEELHTSELVSPKSAARNDVEFPSPQPQDATSVCSSENVHTQASETAEDPSLKKSPVSTGKDADNSSSTDQDNNVYKRKTRSQSDIARTCSETEAHTSSSRKANDSKSKTNSDSRSKDVKGSSSNSRSGDKDKNSSKRSENHENSSSYSKPERDSRNTSSRSSRSDWDRRRSKSRSRSRSRGSRTTSSHSRSERSRCDRGSRSERSYYHESDRRSRRSSPRRERRRSRSRTDRTRYSSDSEDDHRKMRTRASASSRSSNYSSSTKTSQPSSYSKPDKSSKSGESPHSSEYEKRTSRSERTSKRLSESDSQHKRSPDLDSSYRKSSSHHKSETNTKSSSSSTHTVSQKPDKHQKTNSSDSEADYKSKSQPSDKTTGSSDKCNDSQEKTRRPDSTERTPAKSLVKSPRHDRQSMDMFHSPDKALTSATSTESSSQSEREKSDSQQGTSEDTDQDIKETVTPADESLQESLSEAEQETKSGLEKENNSLATASSENLNCVSVTLEDFNVNGGCFSNIPPHVNLKAASTNLSESGDSLTCKEENNSPDCPDMPESSLDALDIRVTPDVLQTTKPVVVEPETVLCVEKESDTCTSPKSDSVCLETENEPTKGQQNKSDVKKSGCTSRKSRWDIVGQDTCESESPNKAACAESKPTVRKVISVKKINVSNDNCQQEAKNNDNIQPGDFTHSTPINQTELSKQDVCSDSSPVTCKNDDQSETSQACISTDHLKLSASPQPKTDEPLQLQDTSSQIDSAADAQNQSGDADENKSRENACRIKLSQTPPVTQDLLAIPSDASDSDNSAYDSDCDKAIKQFHSVVVVPKHSSLAKEADRDSSLHTPEITPHLPEAHVTGDVHLGQVPNQVISQQAQPTTWTSSSDSLNSSVLCQSQSNMIDSTSHSEGSSSVSTQPLPSATHSALSLDTSKQCEQSLKQHDAKSQGSQINLHYQHEDSSKSNVSDEIGFSLGWDFSQSEQPTSTCQQPDSSHGLQLNTNLTGALCKELEPRLSIASSTYQSPNTQINTILYLHPHDQEPFSEIHPDSLTNDHDDYSEDKSSANLSKSNVECSTINTPGSSSFVQGHEISSNSRGPAVPDPPRESSSRPHRGRGPPKKRRPEIESESDNEAEAGPSSKKERQGDVSVSKDASGKTDVRRPLLTLQEFQDASRWKEFAKTKKMPPYFDLIEENLYLTER